MDYNQAWPVGGASQAFDGMHDGMLPPGPLEQPLDAGQSSTWMTSQGQSYPTRFGPPLFIQTQQQSPVHGGGLPSPTPTAAAASPTEWGDRAMSSVDGSWPTISPASPAVRQRRGSGFDHLDTLLYAPSTTSATGDTGLHGCWPSGAGFPMNFSHPYSGIPTSPHGVSGNFNTDWPVTAGPMSVSSLPPANEPFIEPTYSHAFAGNAVETPVSVPAPSNNKLAPSNTSPHAPKRTKTPASASSPAAATWPTTTKPAKPRPNKSKHSPSHSRPSTTTPKITPTTTTPSSSSSGSSKTTRRSTTPAGPSLRTAARRFKRPTPSPKPGESDEHHRARTNHNLVEQQYRHRLHAKFEDLLDALPEWLPLDGEEDGEEDDEDDDMEGSAAAAAVGGKGVVGGAGGKGKGGKNRRMSKVDVLSRAARVIRYLESSLEGTKREVVRLHQELEALKRQLEAERRR